MFISTAMANTIQMKTSRDFCYIANTIQMNLLAATTDQPSSEFGLPGLQCRSGRQPQPP